MSDDVLKTSHVVWEQDGVVVHHCDCLKVMADLSDSSIDLIVTDPPYFKVKGDDWDWQWDTPEQFLAWMGTLCGEWQRVLKPNGSLYVFASPQMAWGVEGEVRKRFNVLRRITLVKHDGGGDWDSSSGRWQQTCKEKLRKYFPRTEAIIFAEHFDADNEDLRRPFNVTADVPCTDVWDFPIVRAYEGKHPCEKPLAMMEHIILASSKPGAMVLDCFAGSGVVGEAARNCKRRAILCELDGRWYEKIVRMLKQGRLF